MNAKPTEPRISAVAVQIEQSVAGRAATNTVANLAANPLPSAEKLNAATRILLQPVSHVSAQHTQNKTSLMQKLIGGAIAGVTGTCIIYPLDVVKTRMQNQSSSLGGYTSGFDCFKKIIKSDGVRGLYRGLPANLVGITPEKAIKLAVNDYSREFLARRYKCDADSLPVHLGMLAGASAGFCQVVVTTPMEMVKINSQMSGVIAQQTGTVAKSSMEIVRELGLKGMYRGTPATLLRDVPFSFIFFPASAYFKSLAAKRDIAAGGTGKVSFNGVFWSGIAAGIIAAGAVTPADVIKTRLQTKRVGPNAVQYRGIAHAAREIYVSEGPKAFFRGATQRCMIIAPLFGITLMVYELQQRFFSG